MTRSALILAFVLAFVAPAQAGVLSPDQAHAMAKSGDIVLVDVRTPREWVRTGLPAHALPIALQNRIGLPRADFIADLDDALGGDRTRKVALICASGVRSAFARRMLEAAGFTDVHDIAAGMAGRGEEPGWLAAGLPTEACGVC